MLGEYDSRFYRPAGRRFDNLVAENCAEAMRLAKLENQLRSQWKNIRIEQPIHNGTDAFRVGETFEISTTVHLGDLSPDDVEIQLYYGQLKSVDAVTSGRAVPMEVKEGNGNGDYRYTCNYTCNESGRHGFTVRAVPRGDDYIKSLPGLITWA